MQPARDKRHDEDHHDRPHDYERYRNRYMLLLRLYRPAYRYCSRNAADGTTDPKNRRQTFIQTEELYCSEVNHHTCGKRDNGGLHDCDRASPDNESEGKSRTEQHDSSFNIVFDPESRIQPFRQFYEIRYDEPEYQGD